MRQNFYKYNIITRRKLVIFLILICLISSSCQKYVDIKRSSSQSLIQSANDCQLLLNNYNVMNVGYPSDGEVSADDYYMTDAGYFMDQLTSADRDLYLWTPQAIRLGALPQWNPYQVVYQANLVMENVDRLKGSSSQAILNDLRGQALFFRAYCFWQIAQLYAKPYIASSATQDLGIPLRLSSDINAKSTRASIEETYKQIISDLEEAVNLLLPNSTVPSRPNRIAANAMLARIYLSMENYSQALVNANLALQGNNNLIDFNTLDTTSSTPFQRFNQEVIFHSVMASEPTLDPGTETSNIAKIDSNLVKTYSSNDLRKKILLKPNYDIDLGTYRFSGNYEPVLSPALFNGLAVDELYLIRAECNARSGNISSAMSDLNLLLKTRWIKDTYIDMSATTVDDALVKILLERRKELLMRGQRWTDLRRLNKDSRFAKTLNRTIGGIKYSLPPNDIRYTLLIPNEVIAYSAIQQNPR